MIIILLSLVCWRITYLLTQEQGPYDIIERFRNWSLQSKASPLFCFYCTSFSVALLLSFFTENPLLYWLVIATGSVFVHLIHERLSK